MLFFVLFLPILFAFIVPIIHKLVHPRLHTGWFVLPIPIIIFLYIFRFLFVVERGETVTETFHWIPSLQLNYTVYIDGLSLLFALLISGIGVLVILYSIFYLSKVREALHNFYIYLLMFMWAMLGLVFSDNVFILYLFWELTSVSSFLLIAFWYQREGSRYGARKSLLITVFGGLAMLSSFVILANVTGTFSIREMIEQQDLITSSPLFVPALVLMLLGAFTKSAQFPFHIWLPDAMEAPTPVSAYLHSATMVKAGIYLVARFTAIFGGSAEWFWLVTAIGLITLFWGSISAVKQTDLKALLAFSTVSQLGLIMSLLGIGSASLYFGMTDEGAYYTVAVLAALFHLINHSTFKGCLFMVIGIIDHETGTRDIRKLGGLIHFMPISFTLAVIGGFSMAGLPPFNGFLSKEMFFTSVLHAAELPVFGVGSIGFLIPFVAWVASVFTFIYCMIIIFKTFFGTYEPDIIDKPAKEAPFGMLIPPIVLAVFVLLFFFYPNVLSRYLLEPALIAVLPMFHIDSIDTEIVAWHGWNTELFMTIGVVLLGTLMYRLIRHWKQIYDTIPEYLTFNEMYRNGLEKIESISKRMTNFYMTGLLRDYFIYIFTFFIVVIAAVVFVTNSFSFDASTNAPVEWFEWSLVIIASIAALAVIFSRSRMTAIINLGVLGYIVAIFFVVFQAPDLALTQLVVETVTVALFLLCYYHLPEFKREVASFSSNVVRVVVSVGVGVIVTVVVLSSQSNRFFETISYYFEDAYTLAGAKNIVNAILVDFRGFDTMLEILVLCMVGLGVYSLIKVRETRREDN